MEWLFFSLIGGIAGWLAGWATDRKGGQLLKPIAAGVAGGLGGGYVIVLLLHLFDTLAPMAGAALGAMAVLSIVAKGATPKS